MKKSIHKKTVFFPKAFTLVELIVVITILSILGTIAFVSFRWYTRDAKNSTRVSDMRTIDKSLSLFATAEGNVPLPDNAQAISYSGWLAWTQWEFWDWAHRELRRVSNIPRDPVTNTFYSYSVTNNRTKYQLGAINEGGLFSQTPSLIPESYALSSEWKTALTLWNYIYYDVVVRNGAECYIISTPSIMLSDIPAGNTLVDGAIYNYVYRGSEHLPNSYSGSLETVPATSWFQTTEVFDSCIMEDLIDLELYIAKVSTAFQPFATDDKYENLIFNSNTRDFKTTTMKALEEKWMTLSPKLIEEFNNPIPDKFFIDTFTSSNGTNITSSSGPDTWAGFWTIASGWNPWAFIINNNALEKTDGSSSFLQVTPLPWMTTENYSVSFDIDDFSGGTISSFLRYIDSDNYYSLDISATWYQLMRRLAGTSVPLANIGETINAGDTIRFWISEDSITFDINGIQKENIIGSWINSIGSARIFMQNSGAAIDNYTLTYK